MPVECSQLGRALDAAGQLGVDVDVGRAALVGVLFEVGGDAGEGDGGAGQPAYALLWNDGTRNEISRSSHVGI